MSLRKWLFVLVFEIIFFGLFGYYRIDEYRAVRSLIRIFWLPIIAIPWSILFYLGCKTIYDDNHPKAPITGKEGEINKDERCYVSIRMDDEQLDSLLALADIDDCTIADEIRTAIEKYISSRMSENAGVSAKVAEIKEGRDLRLRKLLNRP